jgi:hypothetical protein
VIAGGCVRGRVFVRTVGVGRKVGINAGVGVSVTRADVGVGEGRKNGIRVGRATIMVTVLIIKAAITAPTQPQNS